MPEAMSEEELEKVAKRVAEKLKSSELMTAAGLGFRCPLVFKCSKEYNCVAPHSCPRDYSTKLM